MATVTATSSGMAAASSTVADPASGSARPVAGRARDGGATASADPEEGPDVVQDAVEQFGDGAVARPGQRERGDGGGDGSYQT
jgi:hypothetical protein